MFVTGDNNSTTGYSRVPNMVETGRNDFESTLRQVPMLNEVTSAQIQRRNMAS